MYLVLRFAADESATIRALTQIGHSINSIVPGAFTGLDKTGCRFSVSIGADESAAGIMEAFHAFLSKIPDVITDSKAAGLRMTADFAIEPEDQTRGLYYSFRLPLDFLSVLAANQIELEITVYTTNATHLTPRPN